MALVIKDRVKETTTTTGTGTYQLAGAVSGSEGFIQVGDGNTTYYVCTDNTSFEIGIGTFTDASPDTLARTAILQAKDVPNGTTDQAVDWSSGTRTIFCTYPADKAVFKDASNNVDLTALTVDDVAIDGKVVTLTGSTSDTATLTAGTNGTLDIVTTDAGGASANIQITADGTAELAGTTVTLDSSGGITLDADGGTITFADAGSSLGTITSSGYSGNSATASAVAAANLTGDTLASGVTASSLTSVGTLASLTTSGDITVGDDLIVNGGVIDLKTNSGSVAQLKFYCESGNAHAQTLQAQPHSASASDVLTLPTGGNSTLVSRISTDTLTNKTLTSPVLNTGVSGTAIKDEDDMTSDSATHLATQQSIKAYVDAQKADMQFVLEDGDGTEVQITKDSEVKFVEGGGLDINWTDTSTGSDGDPYDLTFTVNAAQTGIESVVNTSLEIGRDADNRIKFGTDNQIIFEVSGGDNVIFKASGEIEATSLDIGSGGADIDGTLEANAITIGGTALNTVIAGVTVTNATTAAVATTVTITDNESTNEDNAIIFTAGGDVDGGNIGLESDGDLTYNPSTGRLTATQLAGTLQTAAQANVTSLGTLTGLTVDGDATLTGADYNVVWDKSDNALEFGDNAKATFGASGDLEIKHNGNNSFITDTGTGSLYIQGSTSIILRSGNGVHTYLQATKNGSVDLYHNNSKKFETTSAGATVTGVVTADGFTIGSAVIAEAELEILDGATVTTAELNILDGVTATASELNIMDGVTATTAELNYSDGVTSAIQTQLDAKATKGFATAMAIAL